MTQSALKRYLYFINLTESSQYGENCLNSYTFLTCTINRFCVKMSRIQSLKLVYAHILLSLKQADKQTALVCLCIYDFI